MNKKAALFHWIIFGVLAALGIFLVLTTRIEIKGLKGDWQIGFLENYYLEAEKDLMRVDQAAKFAGWQSVWELAEKGEFIKSGCGELKGYTLWNELKEWCAVDAGGIFLTKVKGKLATSLPDRDYSGIRLEGKNLIGKGEKKSKVSSGPYIKYTYDTSFKVDLGLDVKKEYEELILGAMGLVSGCRNNKSLGECIGEEKKDSWDLKDCDKEEYNETERKVLFCVESGIKVYNEEGLVPVRYRFALDFREVKETD